MQWKYAMQAGGGGGGGGGVLQHSQDHPPPPPPPQQKEHKELSRGEVHILLTDCLWLNL